VNKVRSYKTILKTIQQQSTHCEVVVPQAPRHFIINFSSPVFPADEPFLEHAFNPRGGLIKHHTQSL